MNSSRVFLGLGSNLGDRREHLSWAVGQLESILSNIRVSSLYSTAPRDYTAQPDFLNLCVSGLPLLSPPETLKRLLELEARRGRDRSLVTEKGPRPLDMDILLWGTALIRLPELEVPHPRLCEREFVLIPLLELDPFLVNPESGVPLGDSLKALEPQGIYYFTL